MMLFPFASRARHASGDMSHQNHINKPHGFTIGLTHGLTKDYISHNPANNTTTVMPIPSNLDQGPALTTAHAVACGRNSSTSFQVRVSYVEEFVLSVDHHAWTHALGHMTRIRLNASVSPPQKPLQPDQPHHHQEHSSQQQQQQQQPQTETAGFSRIGSPNSQNSAMSDSDTMCVDQGSPSHPQQQQQQQQQQQPHETDHVTQTTAPHSTTAQGNGLGETAENTSALHGSTSSSTETTTTTTTTTTTATTTSTNSANATTGNGGESVLPIVSGRIVGCVNGDNDEQVMEYLSRDSFVTCSPHVPNAVFFSVNCPLNTVAGEYVVRVEAFLRESSLADESLLWSAEVSVTVFDVPYPPPRDFSFHLDLWQHVTSIATHHHTKLWSDLHFAIVRNYFHVLSQLGQKAVTVVVTDMPWVGQQCYREPSYPSYLFEHSVITTYREPNGSIRIDFTAMDKLLDLATTFHMDREIELIGLVGVWADEASGFGGTIENSVHDCRVPCVDVSTGCVGYLRQEGEFLDFVRELHNHLLSRGCLSRVRVCADEPKNPHVLAAQLVAISQVAPGFSFKSAIDSAQFLKQAPAGILDFVPNFLLAAADIKNTNKLKSEVHARGGRVCWYVCCNPPYPNTFLRSPPMEGVLHGWLTFFLRLDGFLRWNFCLWPADPWKSVSWRNHSWQAGDMYFVLPGQDGLPVETLRLETLREGILDYELLRMAEETLPESISTPLFNEVYRMLFHTDSIEDITTAIKQWRPTGEGLYSLRPSDFCAARRKVLEALQAHPPSPMESLQ